MKNQGKTDKQVKDSNTFAMIGAILMIVIILISWIFKLWEGEGIWGRPPHGVDWVIWRGLFTTLGHFILVGFCIRLWKPVIYYRMGQGGVKWVEMV